MKNIKQILFGLVVAGGLALAVAPAHVGAIDVFSGACNGVTDSAVCNSKSDTVGATVKKVINTLLYLLGAAAVIVIIIAGITYTTSGGDSGSVTKAKNMLLYAIIGLVVAIMAFAIVNFVLTQFK